MKLNQNSDWLAYLPPYDPQYFSLSHTDMWDCLSESSIHIIEMWLWFQTGTFRRFSPRALAKLSNTSHTGNSIDNIINALNTYGLIDYNQWPNPDNLATTTWDLYYADIPQDILNSADKSFSFSSGYIADNNILSALQEFPIWLQVEAGTGATATEHFVAQYNQSMIFDSEGYATKSITAYQPLNHFQLIIKSKAKPMYNKVVKKDGKTFGVLIQTPNGDQIIYATSPEQWISWSKPDSYGLNTANSDGTASWDISDCIHLSW